MASSQALLAVPTARRERVLGQTAVLALAGCAVPVLATAGALHGTAGIVGAAAGVGLVAVLFVLAAALQSWAAGRSPSTWVAVVAGGFGARLGLYLLILGWLSGVEHLHRPSLAIATAVTFVVTLAVEIRLLARSPELFWLEAPARATASSHQRS